MGYEDDQDEIIESAREIASLRAERDRYCVVAEEANWKGAGFEASAKKAEAEVERLKGWLSSIRALHDEYDGPHTYCRECGGLTPCDTMVVAKEKSDG